MIRKVLIFLAVMSLVFSNVNPARAGLTNLGNGLIYDDYLKIIWLQDANYAMTSGYDGDGKMNWDNAKTWAENLNYKGYTDWRLPTSDTSCSGSNCAGSEMGHLYYVDGITSSNPNMFINVQSSTTYWSGTEYDSGNAWRFSFYSGTQDIVGKNYNRYAWAVHDVAPGTIPVVPEPVSSTLFLSGGVTLAFRYWRKKKVK